jgi:oligopeptide/dipeptide ABC transporter ATP-binding protein
MSQLACVSGLEVEYAVGDEVVRALDGVDLTVEVGETLAIVGESGSGKSTLGQALGGLLPPNATRPAGDVTVGGQSVFGDVSKVRAVRRDHLAFIFQNPMHALDPTRRIRAQFADVDAEHDEVLRLLRLVELKNAELVARKYPHELSGGMAQRVAIALALAQRPRLVVADEPTASLDSSVRNQILDVLFELARRDRVAIAFLSHDLRAAFEHCARVAVMYGGRIVELGPTEVVAADPQHPYTQALLSSALGAERFGERLNAIPGIAPVLRGAATYCTFHPRCPRAIALCTTCRPDEREVANRRVACHLAGEPDPAQGAPTASEKRMDSGSPR